MIDTRRQDQGIGSFVFGVGFGAFVDGIMLRQILQRHHMLSSRPSTGTDTVDGLELNVLADGLFHVAALVALVAGTVILQIEWLAKRHHTPDDRLSCWRRLRLRLEPSEPVDLDLAADVDAVPIDSPRFAR